MSISPTTQEEFYSGDWKDIENMCRVLQIGQGKLAKITEQLVEFYQEMVDREIDGQLNQYYYTPLRSYNQYIPANDTTIAIFPGAIRSLARYWTTGTLLLSEFQSLEQNITEQAQKYIDESKQKIFDIIRYSRRIPGQLIKHNLKTAPPSMMPGVNPELNI